MISSILATVTAILVIVGDRLTKSFILSHYTLAESHDIIPGLIDFTFVNNSGGAWGMLSGHIWILLSFTIVAMMVCVAMLLKYGFQNKLMFWSMMLILNGGIGNMIDRIIYKGQVVDFIHFTFFPTFPVFNVADCAIVIGGGLLILCFIISAINDKQKSKHYSPTMHENTNDNG